MDEDTPTTLSSALVESPEYASTMWSIPDDIRSQQKPRANILARPESLNKVPEWLRTPLRRFLRLKQRNWPGEDCPTIYQPALQPPEPYYLLFHPAL